MVKFGSAQFPLQWRGFTQVIAGWLQKGNDEQKIRALKVLEKITEKYEYSRRSDPLYQEIIYVVSDFHDLLFQLLKVGMPLNYLTGLLRLIAADPEPTGEPESEGR